MNGWQLFWNLWLLFSGAAFAAITIVVTVKGFGDVRRMLSGIKAQDNSDK
jgi:hypothetical protein